MIHTFYGDREVHADVCIIGSGAGGSAAAQALSAAGRKVVVLERGSFLTPKDFSQREDEMFPKLFYEAGGRRTVDRAIRVLHGHGVGGSTLHNINLCKRIPDEVLGQWDLGNLGAFASELHACYARVEELLGVSQITDAQVNRNNRLFQQGLEKLGYAGARLHHNRQGCVGSGFCELGCAFDAKMNALRVLLPQAVRHGAEIYADTRAVRIEWSGRRASKVHAEILEPEQGRVVARVVVHAKAVVCSGGAIETPLLLLRSGVPDPSALVGQRLHLHPGAVAFAEFAEPVMSWQGIPQSYECTEFLEFGMSPKKNCHRIWMIAGSAHPAGAAALLPGFGAEHAEWMEKLPRLACITPMLHDTSRGSVSRKGDFGAAIDYRLNDQDREQLGLGLREAARILLAAGAKEAVLPFVQTRRFSSFGELDAAVIDVRPLELDLVAVHPMSSVWMGKSDAESCLDSNCRYWQLDNVFVADTSVFPTSLGVPPQMSAYAIGFYVAEKLLKS